MLAVRMNILGTRQIDFAIKGLLKVVNDWRPLWPKVTEEFHRLESRHFSSQGASGRHGAWAALNPRYAERKRRTWGRRPIMVASGRLRGSLTSRTGFSIVDDSSPVRLGLGTMVPYAKHHQNVNSSMPTRRVIDFTDRQNLDFAKLFHRYVNTDALKQFDNQRNIPFGTRES